MVHLQLSRLVLGLAAVVAARKCQDITISVDISARNGVFNIEAPVSNVDVTDFILNLSQQGGNYSQKLLSGYATVSGTYKLATTYCEPDKGPSNTVQLLTHGIGFDRNYWDFPANNYNYSYVEDAVDHYGYSTLAWDRLGIGMSQHGEPVNEIQAWLEVAALVALTKQLRAGSIEGCPHEFAKVVHVGHSFGSLHTYALTSMYPDLSDGIILTGFSQNGSFTPYFELGSNFVQANTNPSLSSYVNGYLAASSSTGVQIDFFAPGDFDPAILQQATATGQPVTVGELLTISGEAGNVNNFAKPVLIITGERDIPFCGGNCFATGNPSLPSILDSSKMFLPSAMPLQTFVVPGAGHGLNLQYSHTITYGKMLDFLVQNGLST